MAVELKIPTAGESITEVEIGEWFLAVGDSIAIDDPVVLIETDKASMELPAPVSGVLTQILKKAGEVAEVGEVIGLMEEKAVATGAAAESGPSAETKPAAAAEQASSEPIVMPAAQRALATSGLEAKDVKPTGPGGRLLKEDVQRHQESSQAASAAAASAPAPVTPKAASPEPVSPAATGGARQVEAVRMSRLRRRIAERLVDAQQQAALLTTFNEVDMSAVMAFRSKHKEAFLKRHGVKLGFMSFFVKAVIEGLKEVPGLNAELQGDEILYRNYYDIGVAVGGGRGLVVPVIRNAERLSFAGVEQTIGDLARRAQDGTIQADELQGGTFTISNGGIYGSMLSTPIVNPPQSGILGMHNIKQRPVAIDGEVVIRPIMYVALTYDHRIVDGREAVGFLVRVKDCIEQPARMLLEV